LYDGETIAAISTPLGEGGIGIVRISGKNALKIAKKIFKPRQKGAWLSTADNRKLIYGHICDRQGKIVDEVLLAYMKGPYTYTREDVVEINCHGGTVSLRKILEVVLAAGARTAEPGEFTKRAFLNGRLDLAQAESVIDIVRSKTEAGLNLAVTQLGGKLSGKIVELQERLLGLLARVEANIDFPEEDLEEATGRDIIRNCDALLEQIEQLLEGAEAGKIYREGINTIIIGSPNVGKSSLLNALLQENRAIVTEIPGTTRDIIEEIINVRGIPLKIIDTAGLRETEDLVEKIGVEKTREMMDRAGLILLVIDAARGLTEEDLVIIDLIKNKKAIFILNKADVKKLRVDEKEIKKLAGDRPVLWVSALEGTGLGELEEIIVATVFAGQVSAADEILVANARHKKALEDAAVYLKDAVRGISAKIPVDVVSIDIRAAWESLGEITGSTVTEDLLDRIFADFCIGK
jgi:tRNA modification GTPase